MFPQLHASISGKTFHKPSGGLYLNPYMADLVSGAITKVTLTNIIPGFTDDTEDTVNNRIVPGVPGFYLMCGQIGYKNAIATKDYQLMIKENNVTKHSMYVHSSIFGVVTISFSKIWVVNLATDYYELFARQNSGVNTVDIEVGLSETYLMMQRIR